MVIVTFTHQLLFVSAAAVYMRCSIHDESDRQMPRVFLDN